MNLIIWVMDVRVFVALIFLIYEWGAIMAGKNDLFCVNTQSFVSRLHLAELVELKSEFWHRLSNIVNFWCFIVVIIMVLKPDQIVTSRLPCFDILMTYSICSLYSFLSCFNQIKTLITEKVDKVVNDQVVRSFGSWSIHVRVIKFTQELCEVSFINKILGRIELLYCFQLIWIFD